MSKGSARRPAAVDIDANWARTFGKADSERCKGVPAPSEAETIPVPQDGGRGPQTGDYEQVVLRLWMADRRRTMHEYIHGRMTDAELDAIESGERQTALCACEECAESAR